LKNTFNHLIKSQNTESLIFQQIFITNYKNAYGQIQAYNHGDDKQLIVAFYGDYKDKQKVIDLFHSKKIEVWDLEDTPDGINIKKFRLEDLEYNDFHKWMDENTELKRNGILQLSNVCELYLGKKLPSRVSTNYKKEIEKYIKDTYTQIEYMYNRQFWQNGLKYKGWRHIQLHQR
jgi:hypothetical protein